VPYEQAKVSVLTHALNYGTAAFGGMRGYWNPEQQQLFLFRPHDHFRRFLNSAKLLRMNFDHTPESLTRVTLELIATEGYQRDIYLRPLAYKDEIIGGKTSRAERRLSIVAVPLILCLDQHQCPRRLLGLAADDNSIPALRQKRAYASSAFVNRCSAGRIR
jgi:branched-chain amino acid aminotransferase